MSPSHFVTSFYVFYRLEDIDAVKSFLKDLAIRWGLEGLIIIAPEGMNGTLSTTSAQARVDFQKALRASWPAATWSFKDSESETRPFHRFIVKIRPEIVTLKRPEHFPQGSHFHLKPKEWDEVLRTEKVTLIDTRNDYEAKLGTFKNAIIPPITEFGEFSDYLKKSNLPKDEKILIFCTGGIRCEKAILEMNRQGYNNVWQLEGGILKYFEETTAEHYDGECFVFDHRVSLDKNLKPTGKSFCPHCGQPADTTINCGECGKEARVCSDCLGRDASANTCSKNCAHHHGRKKTSPPSRS